MPNPPTTVTVAVPLPGSATWGSAEVAAAAREAEHLLATYGLDPRTATTEVDHHRGHHAYLATAVVR